MWVCVDERRPECALQAPRSDRLVTRLDASVRPSPDAPARPNVRVGCGAATRHASHTPSRFLSREQRSSQPSSPRPSAESFPLRRHFVHCIRTPPFRRDPSPSSYPRSLSFARSSPLMLATNPPGPAAVPDRPHSVDRRGLCRPSESSMTPSHSSSPDLPCLALHLFFFFFSSLLAPLPRAYAGLPPRFPLSIARYVDTCTTTFLRLTKAVASDATIGRRLPPLSPLPCLHPHPSSSAGHALAHPCDHHCITAPLVPRPLSIV